MVGCWSRRRTRKTDNELLFGFRLFELIIGSEDLKGLDIVVIGVCEWIKIFGRVARDGTDAFFRRFR